MRTGIFSEFRKCPRHGSQLEVGVREGSELLTNLEWWCAECRGGWSELYFTMKVEASLPLMAMSRRFTFRCPTCASKRISRSCNFDCCDYHYCSDCKQYFFIDYKIEERSKLSKEVVEGLKKTVWLDDASFISTINSDRFEHFPVSLSAPVCEEHPNTGVTLAMDQLAGDERFRFGWFCKDCDQIFFDYSSSDLELIRDFFTLSESADFRCRVCHHVEFDQGEDLHDARCLTCGTLFRLKTTLSDAPP